LRPVKSVTKTLGEPLSCSVRASTVACRSVLLIGTPPARAGRPAPWCSTASPSGRRRPWPPTAWRTIIRHEACTLAASWSG
jgi:hypothetical protein